MNINELTIGQLHELHEILHSSPHMSATTKPTLWEKFFTTGKKVFIRSVTHHYTGRVVACDENTLLLDNVAWIASNGRFHAALATGEMDEVEPYPEGVEVALALVVVVALGVALALGLGLALGVAVAVGLVVVVVVAV